MNSQLGTLKEYYMADLALHSYYAPSQIKVPNPLMAQNFHYIFNKVEWYERSNGLFTFNFRDYFKIFLILMPKLSNADRPNISGGLMTTPNRLARTPLYRRSAKILPPEWNIMEVEKLMYTLTFQLSLLPIFHFGGSIKYEAYLDY